MPFRASDGTEAGSGWSSHWLLSLASANLSAAIGLLQSLQGLGLRDLVLCPGSRSGPLATAAGLLADRDRLRLLTAIDERSAAFLALGLATASGDPVAVITTSGTAVANLLPAAVEADRSCQPILFLTADRPERLKNCGANQTVNQEDFLASVCRSVLLGPSAGLHQWSTEAVAALARQCWADLLSASGWPPGPVHCNLPFEEPLHASVSELEAAMQGLSPETSADDASTPDRTQVTPAAYLRFDPHRAGVVIAGPWRGLANDLPAFQTALAAWLQLTGWPLLADPLSAAPSGLPTRLHHWELLLPDRLLPSASAMAPLQVLRLGPLPASRRLEAWLQDQEGPQLLISEGDQRPLDPLQQASQYCHGLSNWMASQSLPTSPGSTPAWVQQWLDQDQMISRQLESALPCVGACNEPALALHLAQHLPDDWPVMLAASSPVRDWMIWSGAAGSSRRCYSFRGASGLDGTLSLAMGLCNKSGRLLLLTGDLALLHDTNGWLHTTLHRPPLIVVLIDNSGGGIFRQLPIHASIPSGLERLFVMPQQVDPLVLASAYGVPGRQVSRLEDLPMALEWAIALNTTVLLRVSTDAAKDATLRLHLRDRVRQQPLV